MNITRERFGAICEEVWQHIRQLNQTKGEEYTGGQGAANVHANFDRLSAKLNIAPDKVLWVYLTKHLDAIETYINELDRPTRRALAEPMSGRVDDAILYLLLWRAMDERRTNVAPAPAPGSTTPFRPDTGIHQSMKEFLSPGGSMTVSDIRGMT